MDDVVRTVAAAHMAAAVALDTGNTSAAPLAAFDTLGGHGHPSVESESMLVSSTAASGSWGSEGTLVGSWLRAWWPYSRSVLG